MPPARMISVIGVVALLLASCVQPGFINGGQDRLSLVDEVQFSLAASADRAITLVDPESGAIQALPIPDGSYGVGSPEWSPDGQELVFAGSAGGGDPDEHGLPLFRTNADGSGFVQLTPSGSHDQRPRWSPDGTQILFERSTDTGFRIYIMNRDGSGERPELSGTLSGFVQLEPAWSPDGTHIAFVALDPHGDSLIYLARSDGTDVRVLFDPEEHLDFVVDSDSYQPVWSPDGSQIAFISYAYTGDAEIVVINADGTDPRNVSNGAHNDYDPAWSPDGQQIAFISGRDGEYEQVYAVNPDGSSLRQVTTHAGEKRSPAWSPDGNWLAFTSNPTDEITKHCGWEWQLQRIAVDGSQLQTLADHVLCHSKPAWRPTAGPTLDPAKAFQATWSRTDQLVTDGVVDRTWIWGPEPFTEILAEPYAESPNGARQVRYYDKGRMEITSPDADPSSPWYVTSGLLIVEMITGRAQVGSASFETRLPAQISVAGDVDGDAGPTYATLAGLLDRPPNPVGGVVTESITRASGRPEHDPALVVEDVYIAITDDVTNHSIAAPFWEFMTSTGIVYEDGQLITEQLFEHVYIVTGRPITEPYWTIAQVGGTYLSVLIQCFERRCLTYTPDNPDGWQVEAGNVGRHYHQWRYSEQIDELRVIDTGTTDATLVGTDGSHAAWMVSAGQAIHAASLSNPEPFSVVTEPALRSTGGIDGGVVIWDEADASCVSGCSTLYGKRIGDDAPFVIAPGGRGDETETIQSYAAIAYPWVAWLRIEGEALALLVRNIETMAEPFILVASPTTPLEQPVIAGDRVVWLEEVDALDLERSNRLMTQRTGENASSVIAESVEPHSYAVGGELIVYADVVTDALYEHDLATGETIEIHEPPSSPEVRPRNPVTDGRFIFWIEDLPQAGEGRIESVIWGYDVETRTTFQVAGPALILPSLDLTGGVLAWVQDSDGGTDMLYAAPLSVIVPVERSLSPIAFVSNCAGSDDIYTASPDGSNLRQLTDTPENDEHLAWSPDGRRNAFVRGVRDGSRYQRDLYVMNADGSGLTKLSERSSEYPHYEGLAWSPDGAALAFTGYPGTALRGLYVMSAQGSEPRRLTPEDLDVAEHVSWSPDGQRIAFAGAAIGFNPQLYIINVDGTGLVQLTDGIPWSLMPAWSPDGEQIAYMVVADPTFEAFGIYLTTPDGNSTTRLTDMEPTAAALAWSPDGTKLAFTSLVEGNHQIFVMQSDGSGLLPISLGAAGEFSLQPSWSPDSSRIAFTSFLHGGNQEVYVVKADGSELVNLTNDPAWDRHPAWAPEHP